MFAEQKAGPASARGIETADLAQARPKLKPSGPPAVVRIVFVVLLGAVLAVNACGPPPASRPTGTVPPTASGPSGDTRHGTVTGHLTAGPCANAEPPAPGSCQLPAVGNAKIDFVPAAGGPAVTARTAPGTGEYRLDLDAGSYTVRVEDHVFNVSNRGETRTVEVRTSSTTTLDLVVDTGIRGPAAGPTNP